MRYKLICCEVLYREMCRAVSDSQNIVDVEFLPKGLHDLGQIPMLERIQAALDRVDESNYDAVLFGYALCNNGLVGLKASVIPIVLPRGHDCITLFLGSRERYEEYFYANQGTYFKTSGWMERGTATGELTPLTVQRKSGMDMTYEQMVQKYGEENAKYLWETLGDGLNNYSKITFIEMGIEPHTGFEQESREETVRRGWKFEKIRGDMRLITSLVNGNWPENDFLVVQPGQVITAAYDGSIMKAESC